MCKDHHKVKGSSTWTGRKGSPSMVLRSHPSAARTKKALDTGLGMMYAYFSVHNRGVRGWSPAPTRRPEMENHELRVTYEDGGKRTYSYASLPEALHHAIGVAHLDAIKEVSVWTVSEKRVFAYTPAQPSKALQRAGA